MPAPETVRDLRRSQVIAAARALVADEGLEALTIGALEKRLSFSRGVITYHFQNKEDIVVAVFDSVVDEIGTSASEAVRASLTLPDMVSAVLRSMVYGYLERPEAARIMFSFWGRLSDPRIRRANARLYAGYRRQATLLIAQGQSEGEFRPLSPEAMATLLVGLVIGIVTQSYFDPEAIDVEDALLEAQQTVLARLHTPQA